jgi:hypothetical protein
MMYSIGQDYKFQVKGDRDEIVYYTGKVVGKEGPMLQVETFRGEEVGININNINQSKKIKNSTGDANGHKESNHSQY